MLSERVKDRLKELAGVTEDVDFEINRKSKWVLEIGLVKGLCIFAKFKINCRLRTVDRVL